jgi:hypothetical protein
VLTLYSGPTFINQNDDWCSDSTVIASIEAEAISTGAFAWARGSKDAALLVTLPPGNYSAQVAGKNGGTGVALIEVYDADEVSSPSRLTGLSSRAETSPGANVVVAGFVVSGANAKKILIRASGPALSQFGVPGLLSDPVLTLFSGQTILNQNDDWSSDSATAPVIEAAAAAAGAFPWVRGSKDAALVVTLPPGAYTSQVLGKNAATGVTLIEVYEMP